MEEQVLFDFMKKSENTDRFARHIAALDGCWYGVRQEFLDMHGRPTADDSAGQGKFEEFIESYVQGIKERFKLL